MSSPVMQHLAMLTAASALTACLGCRSIAPVGDSGDLLPLVPTGSFMAVIIPGDESKAGESWTPTPADVLGAEPVILECARARDPYVAKHWHRYARQYSGASRHGNRVMYIGLFDIKFHPLDRLRRGLVIVDDGGTDYLELTYDVGLRQCVNRRES